MEIRTVKPATGEPIANYQTMEAGEVYAVAAAAHQAHLGWR